MLHFEITPAPRLLGLRSAFCAAKQVMTRQRNSERNCKQLREVCLRDLAEPDEAPACGRWLVPRRNPPPTCVHLQRLPEIGIAAKTPGALEFDGAVLFTVPILYPHAAHLYQDQAGGIDAFGEPTIKI